MCSDSVRPEESSPLGRFATVPEVNRSAAVSPTMRPMASTTPERIPGILSGSTTLQKFDKDWNLLTPFRTWQNTITAQAAEELTGLFGFNIPQRWSIAHLYQAILSGEPHVADIAHMTTLAGYVHHALTGVNAVGIGEASGIFPIDSGTMGYDRAMLEKFDHLIADRNLPWSLESLHPPRAMREPA